ncbi:MAG: cysteine--tRNA ligase [Dehalococcoidales bacterium]|nr:cysteine--tRNA ligase [Dehalococcoidales bacterium]
MKIYNTLTSQKEEFVPQGDTVLMYVCGVTPYDNSHLGHAMSYIYFDVVRRYLKYRGYKVKFVQNVTDIDDKIINRANQIGIPPNELAEKFTQSFFDDITALNVVPADIYPRATQEIPKIIEVIKGLAEKGYAYPSQGSVYFRVRQMTDYGKLSHRTLDMMMAGARIESGEEKEDPRDFVLWKGAKPGEPQWESPWGPGRPGWHIECSAMSLKYLGATLDIHGGGQDLIFPHHENEIAQSESFTGKKPFVKYWMHNAMLQLGTEKMSKSLGNLITIKDALQKFGADALRIFFLSGHYRSPITYTTENVESAGRGAERLQQAATAEAKENAIEGNIVTETYKQRFIDAMDDDFNTAQAIAVLFDLVRDINRTIEGGASAKAGQELLKELSKNLGLTLKSPEKSVEATPFIELLIATRKQLRDAKQFQLADDIRTKLLELGIVLEDTAKGTTWKGK